jgi:hypothetical protein
VFKQKVFNKILNELADKPILFCLSSIEAIWLWRRGVNVKLLFPEEEEIVSIIESGLNELESEKEKEEILLNLRQYFQNIMYLVSRQHVTVGN